MLLRQSACAFRQRVARPHQQASLRAVQPPRRLRAFAARAALEAVDAGAERAVQFMVDMSCQSCVGKVHASLDSVPGASAQASHAATTRLRVATGVRSVAVDLDTQTVMVEGTAGVEQLLDVLTSSGRNARLIGQGSVAGTLVCRRSLDEI